MFLLALYSTVTVAVAMAVAVAVAVVVAGIPPVLDCEYSRYSCKRTPLRPEKCPLDVGQVSAYGGLKMYCFVCGCYHDQVSTCGRCPPTGGVC